MEKEKIQQFIESLKVNDPIEPKDFHKAIKGAYMDRSRQVYFIWKKLKELYPEVDADKVIREGSWDFGVYQGQQMVKQFGTDDVGPEEVVLGQTSRGGWLVFEQEILELNEDRAIKMFNACPHSEAFRDLGCSDEEVKQFCRNMLGWCDYGICAPFPNVKIEFPTTVADGEGKGCAMTITRVKPLQKE